VEKAPIKTKGRKRAIVQGNLISKHSALAKEFSKEKEKGGLEKQIFNPFINFSKELGFI